MIDGTIDKRSQSRIMAAEMTGLAVVKTRISSHIDQTVMHKGQINAL